MIIPVVDLKDGMCVSGKSGNRDTYTKLKSIYGNAPQTIAYNLKKKGAKVLYIADLDKIENKADNSKIISSINEIIPVLLDNGISSLEDVRNNEKICTYNILATETMKDLNNIYEIFKKCNRKDLVISVDIKNNDLLINNNDITLNDIIELINITKPKCTIILNISQVGTKEQSASNLINEIITKTPDTTHLIAGGITNESIEKYQNNGIGNFLVGTTLHEGNLKYNF